MKRSGRLNILTNERTFLAWIRTSVAVVSLGFLIARFSVWLRELAVHREPQVQTHHGGISLPIGVAMMTFGGLLAVLAAWRYHMVNRDIERGKWRRSWTGHLGYRDGSATFWSNDRPCPANGRAAVTAATAAYQTTRKFTQELSLGNPTEVLNLHPLTPLLVGQAQFQKPFLSSSLRFRSVPSDKNNKQGCI